MVRTKSVVLVVFVIAAASSMVTASGLGDVWGAEPPQSAAAQEELDDSASAANPNNAPVEGPVSSGESSLTGLIVDGGQSLVNFAGAALALPATLMGLGFPAWFSEPVGRLAQFLAGVGAIQFIVGRVWE